MPRTRCQGAARSPSPLALDDACRTLRISVEDNGAGFLPEQLAGGANGSGSRKPFGLGLGLRLCREIATEHGGRLELGGSDTLGGARATIELPTDTIT